MRYQRHNSPPIGAVTLLLSIYIVYAAVVDPWLLVIPVLGTLVTAAVILAYCRAARRHPWLQSPDKRAQERIYVIPERDIQKLEEQARIQQIQREKKRYPYQLANDERYLIPCVCAAWTSEHTHTSSPRTIVTANGELVKAFTAASQPGPHYSECRAPSAELTRAVADAKLNISNPASVIRQRLESGALYVPLGACSCAAYPRVHQHAGTAAERSVVAQHHVVRPAVKPCTEGGPCRVGHRRVVRNLRGVRVASLCTRCGRHEYWQPFLDLGVS